MAAGAIEGGDEDQESGGIAPATAPPAALGAPAQPAAPSADSDSDDDQGQVIQHSGALQKGPPMPPQDMEYDSKKLAKAQTPLDVLNAMKTGSRKEYMDWYEQTHGAINDHYDALMQRLGQRPTDQGLSKKEKFAALMQFGMHLLQNSAKPQTNQGSALIGASNDAATALTTGHDQNVAGQQGAYDKQANAIESARQGELNKLGTFGDAMKTTAGIEGTEAKTAQEDASAYSTIDKAMQPKPPGAIGTIAQDKSGNAYTIERDDKGNPVAKPVTGIDGKPFQGRVLGKETGSGIEKGDTAQMKNFHFLKSLGLDDNSATDIVFKPKTGDATKDHAAIYRSILQSTGGDTDAAQKGADNYIETNYGRHALAGMNNPSITPPASALVGLTPGHSRTFANGQVWSVGIDGKPFQVNQIRGGQNNAPPPGQ